MRLLAEKHLYISPLSPKKNQVHMSVFNGFYGGHVKQLTDICKQLSLGRRGDGLREGS